MMRGAGRARVAAVLLGAVALTGVCASVPLAGAQAEAGVGGWSDARWAPQGALNGPVGAVGVLEVDWQAGEGTGADTSSDADLRLELPAELAPVSGDGGTATTVTLLDGAGLPGGTGTWVRETATSPQTFVLEVDLDEASVAAAAEAGETLGGTLGVDVTWAEEAADALSPGEQTLEVKGPGLGSGIGKGAAELTAVYAQAVDQEPVQTTTTPVEQPMLRPAQADVEVDVVDPVEGVAADDGVGEADEDIAAKPKPKPTKPKPTGKPKPNGDGLDDADKPEKVIRDADGREKVKSVPAGPVGAVSMPTIG